MRQGFELRLGPAGLKPSSAASAGSTKSSCNKDFSCLDGFCPSFVTVSGPGRASCGFEQGLVRRVCRSRNCRISKRPPVQAIVTGLAGRCCHDWCDPCMAAHLEGRGCGMIDHGGPRTEGRAVFSHIRLAKTPEEIHAIRVSAGMADLILVCDLVVSGSKKVRASVNPGEPPSLSTRPRFSG